MSMQLFERASEQQQIDRAFLRRWRWSHLIMDEAHAIKNKNASRTKRLNRCCAARVRRVSAFCKRCICSCFTIEGM